MIKATITLVIESCHSPSISLQITALLFQVIAVCQANKSDQVKQYGAHHTIDYKTQNIRQQTKAVAPNGVDIVFDAVGGDGAIDLVKRYSPSIILRNSKKLNYCTKCTCSSAQIVDTVLVHIDIQ